MIDHVDSRLTGLIAREGMEGSVGARIEHARHEGYRIERVEQRLAWNTSRVVFRTPSTPANKRRGRRSCVRMTEFKISRFELVLVRSVGSFKILHVQAVAIQAHGQELEQEDI